MPLGPLANFSKTPPRRLSFARGMKALRRAAIHALACTGFAGGFAARTAAENVDLAKDLVWQRATVDTPTDVPAQETPNLGTRDFAIALWVHTEPAQADLHGDWISRYDPNTRRGFHLTLKSNLGVTSNQPNWRHLQFGIDDDRAWEWEDCGRPGNALFAFALAVHQGNLYAGTCEPGERESGRVYRHAGKDVWTDCGALDGANAVTAFAVHQDRLYAGTGRYRVAGSSLPESKNQTLGGRVYVYEGDHRWNSLGPLPNTEAIGGLVVFRGQLHASSLYKPAGFFRLEEGNRWTPLPVPRLTSPTAPSEPNPQRVEALTVHEGFLYASSYDDGRVWRFDGTSWEDCGRLGENTQTYSFTTYQGAMHVGTWPSGRVYRFEAQHRWTDLGRLGEELEVMGMLVHNGRLIAGSLPLAQIYEYRQGNAWQQLRQLDNTPDVKYRRAWTLAEHNGKVFCSTLPSGRVHAFSAGQQTSWGHSFPPGWHHVAASRSKDRLTLHVDGRTVAETIAPDVGTYRLDSPAPLRFGRGMNGPLNGRLADLRFYARTLSPDEIQALATRRPNPDSLP